MIVQAQWLATSVVLAIISGIGLDIFEETQWLWEINRIIFIASITGIVASILWCIWS